MSYVCESTCRRALTLAGNSILSARLCLGNRLLDVT